MKDTETIDSLHNIDGDPDVLSELRHKLEAELEKPDTELDVERINQITTAIEQVTGTEKITAEKTQQGIQKLKQELHLQNRRNRIRLAKRIAACACFILIVSNIWSYSAYGLNSFSAAYQLLNGGIKIDFQTDNSEPYTGNPYYDEMHSICLNNNFEALIPRYIPGEFQPTDNYGKHQDFDHSQKIYFNFIRQKIILNLSIIRFKKEDEITTISIPSSEYNISQQKIGDTVIHISKEKKDHQYWAAFQIGLTQYILYAEGLDYDECQRVLESMFEKE